MRLLRHRRNIEMGQAVQAVLDHNTFRAEMVSHPH